MVGRVAGAHGVSGALRILSATHPKDNILDYRPWWLVGAGHRRRLEVVSVKPHGEGFVAVVEGIDDRDAALALKGREIAVPREALPVLEDDREVYWRDLIGTRVIDGDGVELGRVVSLMDTGAHDVLVIEPEHAAQQDSRARRAQVLIPFVDAFVRDVDLAAGVIRVDWQQPA